MLIFKKGHEFYSQEGKLICKAARNIYKYDPCMIDDMEWFIERPKVGDDIHPVIIAEYNLLKIGDFFG